MSVLDNIPLILDPFTTDRILPWFIAEKKLFATSERLDRLKGFTCFKLLNRFENGEDIRPIINEYKGYNLARIFPYVNPDSWGSDAWDFPTNSATLEFLDFMRDNGFRVQITLCTDNDSSRINQINTLVNFLKAHKSINLILEAENEPYIHEKLDPYIFKNLLSGSGFLYSSGIYVDNRKFYGQYWCDHSARDHAWYRKGGHNLHEAYGGGGPSFPDEPALKMPGIQGEPIRPDQCGFDAKNLYAYAASCALMGAGAVFHSQNGKLAKILTLDEAFCRDAFLQGLNVFPYDACLGSYRRIIEDGQPQESRTYVVGNYSIRIMQNGSEHPESGWNPLDSLGICWSR